jgi:hypothetical protein
MRMKYDGATLNTRQFWQTKMPSYFNSETTFKALGAYRGCKACRKDHGAQPWVMMNDSAALVWKPFCV